MSDILTAHEISALLPAHLSGIPIHVLGSTDSTNTQLRAFAQQGAAHMTLLCAHEQTAGRGRRGRSFASPPGGVYMSLLLRSYPDALPLTIYAAVAARRALAPMTGDEARIKWVNDILVGSRKVCGILAEAVDGGAIVGIGVNLSASLLPPELDGIAGAVCADLSRAEVIAALTAEFDHVLTLDSHAVLDEYRRYCMLIGRTVSFTRGTEMRGVVTGVSDSGCLLVACPDGLHELDSGEISIFIDHANWVRAGS